MGKKLEMEFLGTEDMEAADKNAMAAKFAKLMPKMIKYCEVKTKMQAAKGRCRAYRRFCTLYKKFGLHGAAKRHCKKMKAIHAAMVKANKPKAAPKPVKKAKKAPKAKKATVKASIGNALANAA